MTNATDLKLTKTHKRILAIIAERPALQFKHDNKWRNAGTRYRLRDGADRKWKTWTTADTIHDLIDAQLIPLEFLRANVFPASWSRGIQYRGHVDGQPVNFGALAVEALEAAPTRRSITLKKTDERQDGAWIWAVHLDGELIGWINRERGTRGSGCGGSGTLSGWMFKNNGEHPSDPLGPRSNSFFVEGGRSEMVRLIELWAAAYRQPGPKD